VEGGIGPGAGHHAGAIARADLLLIGIDQQAERRRIDIALLGQDGLERARTRSSVSRQFRMVVMMIVIVMMSASWRKDTRNIQAMSRRRVC